MLLGFDITCWFTKLRVFAISLIVQMLDLVNGLKHPLWILYIVATGVILKITHSRIRSAFLCQSRIPQRKDCVTSPKYYSSSPLVSLVPLSRNARLMIDGALHVIDAQVWDSTEKKLPLHTILPLFHDRIIGPLCFWDRRALNVSFKYKLVIRSILKLWLHK